MNPMTSVENTVLLEAQGPCGSVRKCSASTITDDASAQVKMSHDTTTEEHQPRGKR